MGGKNSILNVGRILDRSFVLRGDKVGVFKNEDSNVKYQATINNVSTLEDKSFSPSKSLLHKADTNMLLLHPRNKNKVFKMDLERGKVVEEWDTGNLRVNSLIPETKLAQRTPHETVLGLNPGGFFRLDPRTKNKVVENRCFQYSDPRAYKFNCASTTRDGHLVVGSQNGQIRMYSDDSLISSSKGGRGGLYKAPRAKTNLPGFGDPIIGIDVTRDGQWILATCKTYLLIINTVIEENTGFTKQMGKKKPHPRLLKLKQEHLRSIGEVSFTPAKFNYGLGPETTMVTSTGPYIITWNFRKVKQNILDQYQIKKYDQVIVADDFNLDSDKSVIVTMPDEVKVATRKNKQ